VTGNWQKQNSGGQESEGRRGKKCEVGPFICRNPAPVTEKDRGVMEKEILWNEHIVYMRKRAGVLKKNKEGYFTYEST